MPSVLPYVGLLVLSLVAYGPVLGNDFIDLDDGLYITDNPNVKKGLTPENVRWAWTTFHAGYWHPLTWLSLQLDAQLFTHRRPGRDNLLSASAFHLTNWVLHTGTVLLLFVLWRRMTAAVGASFMVAALFAVHPLHVESVAWAAERKDVLSTFLAALCLLAYVRYCDKPRVFRYVLVVMLFVLSLMAKPMHVTLPCVMLLLDYWPLHRLRIQRAIDVQANESGMDARPAGPARTHGGWIVVEKIPLFLLSAAFSVVTVIAQERAHAVITTEQLPIIQRIANAVTGYGWYLMKSFWPCNLSVFYPLPNEGWPFPVVLVSGILITAVTGLAFWQAFSRPWLLVGWLWFLGTLFPVVGVVQAGTQAFADRFSYWPHVGLFVAITWTAKEVVDRFRVPVRLVIGAGAVVLSALVLLSLNQVGYWRDTPTVWQHALDVDPNNHRAHISLGAHMMHRNELARAREYCETALRLAPEIPNYHYNTGAIMLLLGKLDEAEKHFVEALRKKKDFAQAWHDLGLVRLRQGQLDEAIEHFDTALRIQPDAANILASLGQANWEARKEKEAAEQFRQALRQDPSQHEALHGLGMIHVSKKEYDAAEQLFRATVQLQGALIKTISYLGVVMGRRGNWSDATKVHEEAVRLQEQWANLVQSQGGATGPDLELQTYRCRLAYSLHRAGFKTLARAQYDMASKTDPAWPRTFAAQARKLAEHPSRSPGDRDLAYELASQACQAYDAPPVELLDTLAITAAGVGRFKEAIVAAQGALARISRGTALARELEHRLKIFQQGRAYQPE